MTGLKRGVVIVAGAIVALAAVVLVGGALFPRTHVARSAITVPAGIDSVWSAVRNPEGQPLWWDGLARVERLPAVEGRESWRYHTSRGPLDLVVERVDAPTILVTRILAEPDAPFGGTWSYHLESVDRGAGTQVTITEAGYINNLFFRFVANTIMGVHGTADGYLRSLARHYGGETEPEHVE